LIKTIYFLIGNIFYILEKRYYDKKDLRSTLKHDYLRCYLNRSIRGRKTFFVLIGRNVIIFKVVKIESDKKRLL